MSQFLTDYKIIRKVSGDVRTDTVLGLGYVYDAVWTIALALNSSISILEERGLGRLEDFTYESVKMADVFTEAVLNVSFEGISVSDYCYSISIATQTASCVHDACTYNNTVYMVHLADIKFSESVCDVNWQVFSLASRVIQIMYESRRV